MASRPPTSEHKVDSPYGKADGGTGHRGIAEHPSGPISLVVAAGAK